MNCDGVDGEVGAGVEFAVEGRDNEPEPTEESEVRKKREVDAQAAAGFWRAVRPAVRGWEGGGCAWSI